MLTSYRKHTAKEPFHQVRLFSSDIWVHADAPTPDEIKQLIDHYQLDANVVRDVDDSNELPRSERSQDVLYVFLRPAVRSRHGQVMTSPLLAVVTSQAFITISVTGALQAPDIIAATAGRDVTTSDRAGLLLATLSAIIRQYHDLITHTGNYIQDIKRKLQNHEVDNRDFIHFVTVEDNLGEYQLYLQDTLAVIERLADVSQELFSAAQLEELDDTKLYIKQLIRAVSSHNQTIGSIRNAYSTIANNTLNQRMKLLTAFTVLITVPNVFYGMYGMNVPLPFQESPWAYASIVVFTLVVVFAIYGIAKRFRLF